MRQYLYLLLLLSLNYVAAGQDIHFSQFNNAPLYLNPALTGVIDGNHRLNINYREQWSNILRGDALRSASVSYDAKVSLSAKSQIGLGYNSLGDREGELNSGSDQYKFLASYQRRFSDSQEKYNYLSLGADFAIVRRKVDLNNARWPSQSDGNGGFDPNIPPPIDSAFGFDPEFFHADLGLGLLWGTVIDAKNGFTIGIAYAHANRPNVSFFNEGEERLTTKLTIHGRGEFQIGDQLSLAPALMIIAQGEHRAYNFGSELMNYSEKETAKLKSYQLGVWHRTGNEVQGGIISDAIIFSGGLNFSKLQLGFSYDMTISELSQAGTANGAFEISVGYIFQTTQRDQGLPTVDQ